METTTQKLDGQPLVSILMLTYNRADYISLAIESALSQTYGNFELIILDDGSTDNTEEIVNAFTDPRIHYVKDPINKGLLAKRQESLSYAHGKYVAILDSDDYWTQDQKLEKQVSFMEAHPDCAVVGTFIKLIDNEGQEFAKNAYLTTDSDIRNNILKRNQFANSSTLMRKSHLDQTAGYNAFAPTEDLELFLQLGKIGKFANLPEYALAYRIHPGGESYKKARVAKQMLRVINKHKDAYPNTYIGYAKYALLFVLAKLKVK